MHSNVNRTKSLFDTSILIGEKRFGSFPGEMSAARKSSDNGGLLNGCRNWRGPESGWLETRALTSLAMSVYFCFSLGSSTAHQSARILVAPRLSRRGCSCRTSERWRLQKSRKAFMGRRARCSVGSSSGSSLATTHCSAPGPGVWPQGACGWRRQLNPVRMAETKRLAPESFCLRFQWIIMLFRDRLGTQRLSTMYLSEKTDAMHLNMSDVSSLGCKCQLNYPPLKIINNGNDDE